MTTIFDCVNIEGLRVTHFEQLLAYLEHRDNEGDNQEWYYGNRKQFEKRHKDLRKWLQGIIKYARSEGVVIPKPTYAEIYLARLKLKPEEAQRNDG